MKPTTPRSGAARRIRNRPCAFESEFTRTQVDPRVQKLWKLKTGKPAPFGRLRKAFKQQHCVSVNPYGNYCPYRVEDCALAFLADVERALVPWVNDPAAYFFSVTKVSGLNRAENKGLARDRQDEAIEAFKKATSRPGDRGDQEVRDDPGPDLDDGRRDADQDARVRSPFARPLSIGEMFGAYDLGPRQRPTDDGEASSE